MCEFCESLVDTNKKINWMVRSTFADDNIVEIINDCGKVVKDISNFEIYGYTHENKAFFGIGYRQEIGIEDKDTVIISPFSETIQINYCPICGQQISDKLITPEEYFERYRYYINITE